ncbi:MAG: dipeptidase [Chloroflexi bacterium]|nr:dipeptidase [Chloroflexota bacterium]MCI0580153.1 dipeptidase [Chloroflexota bacterium]MCI0649498.1 dipeptidase [Chloroflexota bacterium]MCI0728102.1 dipeptidase [Chloroflexota bacterium]
MINHNESEWQEVHQRATVVDLHAHPGLLALLFRRSLTGRAWSPSWLRGEMTSLTVRTSFDKLEAGGVDVLLSTLYPPERRLFEDIRLFKVIPLKYARLIPFLLPQSVWDKFVKPAYFDVTLKMIEGMEKQVDAYNRNKDNRRRALKVVTSAGELGRVLAQGEGAPLAIIHSVEGAHSLEGKISRQYEGMEWDELDSEQQRQVEAEVLDNLNKLHERGVAYITLAHFYPNKMITPCFPFPEHVALSQVRWENLEKIREKARLTQGLTELGQKVVRKMISLGMMIDVSHATPTARRQIYALVEESHRQAPIVMATHVGAYAINPSPYNLKDWEIKWIADHGGVVGIIFMSHWLMPAETKFGLNAISQHIEHMAEVGTHSVVAIGTDFDGADPPDDLDDASQLPKLTQRLMAEYQSATDRKYTNEQVQKFLGGNALEMLLNGWGK